MYKYLELHTQSTKYMVLPYWWCSHWLHAGSAYLQSPYSPFHQGCLLILHRVQQQRQCIVTVTLTSGSSQCMQTITTISCTSDIYIYVHLIIENGYWLTCRKVTSWYVGLHTNPPSPARHAILQTIATDIGTRCMCTMRTPAYSMPSTLNLAYSCCCIVNVHLTFCYHGDSANYHVGIS